MTDHLKHDHQGDQKTHEVHERTRSVAVPALIAGAVAAALGLAFLTSRREPVATYEPAPTYVPAPAVVAQRDDSESQGNFGPRADDRTGIFLSPEILAACGLNQPSAFFATNSARLDDPDRASLSGVVDCLKTGPLAGRNVEIVGQADMRGSSDYNLGLGQQRSDSVASYLREQGVASEQVRPTSAGKENAQATDPQGMAAERRVDIRLLPLGTTHGIWPEASERNQIMNSTIAGFFDSPRDAMAAADALVARGYSRDQISVLASETSNQRAGSTDVVEVEETKTERAEKGAMLGGFAGLVVGLAAVLIPGVGPFLVLGPLATALVSAGVGATAGGLLGGLTKLGIPHDHAEFFVEGMRQGGTLLLVSAPASNEHEVLTLFRSHNAADVGERIKHRHLAPRAVAATNVAAPTAVAAQPPTTAPAVARTTERRATEATGKIAVPVVEEQFLVGKQAVQTGGVQVRTEVQQRPVNETVTLREEHVHVDRHAVDRPATAADMTAQSGTVEIREREEEAVVKKTARVVEEVIVSKDQTSRNETVAGTVKKSEVSVQPLPARDSGRVAPVPPARPSHP